MSLNPPVWPNINSNFGLISSFHTRVGENDFDQVTVVDLEHLGALALAVVAIGWRAALGAVSAIVDHVGLGEQRERRTSPSDVVQLRCDSPHVFRL